MRNIYTSGLDGTVTCSFLGGADQGSESRTRGVQVWTSCVVESVRLLVAKCGMKMRDDGRETQDNN